MRGPDRAGRGVVVTLLFGTGLLVAGILLPHTRGGGDLSWAYGYRELPLVTGSDTAALWASASVVTAGAAAAVFLGSRIGAGVAVAAAVVALAIELPGRIWLWTLSWHPPNAPDIVPGPGSWLQVAGFIVSGGVSVWATRGAPREVREAWPWPLTMLAAAGASCAAAAFVVPIAEELSIPPTMRSVVETRFGILDAEALVPLIFMFVALMALLAGPVAWVRRRSDPLWTGATVGASAIIAMWFARQLWRIVESPAAIPAWGLLFAFAGVLVVGAVAYGAIEERWTDTGRVGVEGARARKPATRSGLTPEQILQHRDADRR